MAKPKMRMHLSGMPLTDDKVDKVLKLSGVEDSTATNLEDQLYMNDYSVFETEILHLKHSGSPTNNSMPDTEFDQDQSATTSENKEGPTTSERQAGPTASENQTEYTTIEMCTGFAHLPDVVLVHIFSHLGLKDVCRMSQVCKQWNNAAKNPSLWKIVQQSPSESDDLLAFLKGYTGKSLIFLRPFCMNTSGLRFIKQKCTNIQALWLVDIKLAELDFFYLPSSLVSLALVPSKRSHLPNSKWWEDFNHKKFPNLDFLFVAGVGWTDYVIEQVSELDKLTGFRFEDSVKVSDKVLDIMATKLTNLTFLSFAGCSHIGMSAIQSICKHLKLHELRLSQIWTLDPEENQKLLALKSLPDLKILHLGNATDQNSVQVQQFCNSVNSTIHMFSKLDMLVLTDFDLGQAILCYKVVEHMSLESRNLQVSFEQGTATGLPWRVRVIFKDK